MIKNANTLSDSNENNNPTRFMNDEEENKIIRQVEI